MAAFDKAWSVAKNAVRRTAQELLQEHFDATGADEVCCDEMEEEIVENQNPAPDWEFCPWCGDYVTPPNYRRHQWN